MTYPEIIAKLKSLKNPKNVTGMARYGISTHNTLGISLYDLRRMAKEMGQDHAIALQLWDSGIHEARILASIIDDPLKVTNEQMEDWVSDFDSWDVCDQVCSNLFDKTAFAYRKVEQWSHRSGEFVKRAAFAVIAALAVQDKTVEDKQFLQFLPIIKREADDERNFVKKAVNWALRNIGKRNINLNKAAVKTAEEILKSAKDVYTEPRRKSGRMWIASDALRELTSEKVQKRIRSSHF